MKKLYIFDFDGTLVNTIIDAGRCFNKSLRACNLPEHKLETYPELIGGNLDITFSKLLSEKDKTSENIEKLKRIYPKFYMEDKKENTKPFDGILEMLLNLQNQNLKLAISSNKKENLILDLCAKFFSKINFVNISGYVEGVPSKPDPCGINNLLSLENISKEETVYVGDAGTDILTAKNAGIDCILVDWGQGKIEDYENIYVSKIISTPKELIEMKWD